MNLISIIFYGGRPILHGATNALPHPKHYLLLPCKNSIGWHTMKEGSSSSFLHPGSNSSFKFLSITLKRYYSVHICAEGLCVWLHRFVYVYVYLCMSTNHILIHWTASNCNTSFNSVTCHHVEIIAKVGG